LRVPRTASITPAEWPCAVSTQITSQPAAIRASIRASRSPPTPTAAPTRRRPSSSRRQRVGLGLLDVLDRDEALEAAVAVDHQQLLDAVLVQQLLGASRPTLSPTVMSFVVITSATGWVRLRSNRTSRLVKMPTGRRSPSTTGRPLIRCWRMSARASSRRAIGTDRHRVDDDPDSRPS
jgi:hypothetical protein